MFAVTKCLGRGAQATVYRARLVSESQPTDEERFVALKVFDGALANSDLSAEVAVHEQLLDHPHIAPLLGFHDKSASVEVPCSLPRHELDTLCHLRE